VPTPAPTPTPAPSAEPDLSAWPESGASSHWYGRAGNGATVNGSSGNDFFSGGSGHVTMAGGGGDDVYTVNHSYDVIVEKAGGGVDTAESWSTSFTLAANVENLVLEGNWGQTGVGNGGNNLLVSTAGKDTLDGGGGDDALVAGTGASRLTGGAGHDLFVFSQTGAHDNVVTDFARGADALDFRPLMKAAGYHGSNAVADHVLALTQVGADVAIAFDADGTGPGGAHTLVTLQHTQLSQLKDGADYYWH
jgi:Ca2+-binding RTX toxin-like protein